jgi:hypothetical protein
MMIDSSIIDFDSTGIPSDKILFIRNFNPRVFKLYFRDEEYDIKLTVNAVKELLEKIQEQT